MGADLPAFTQLATHARKAIGLDLVDRCLTDPAPTWPADELQQAIFVVTSAAAAAARERLPRPDAVVGHSLGDYAALVETDVLSYEAALEIVNVRGRAMARAGDEQPGSMAAVLGLAPDTVRDVCERVPGAWQANINSSGQTVISGTVEGIHEASGQLAAVGGRVMQLPITIACHTPLMAPAADEVRALLERIELRAPTRTFYSTVDAQPKVDGAAIARALVQGMTQPVLFSATVERMRADGIDTFVEIGPGRVLRGLLRRCAPEATVESIAGESDLDRLRSDQRERMSSALPSR